MKKRESLEAVEREREREREYILQERRLQSSNLLSNFYKEVSRLTSVGGAL